eukprot:gene26009-32530_t
MGSDLVYYNDVWVVPLGGVNPVATRLFNVDGVVNPFPISDVDVSTLSQAFTMPIPWQPRTGHSIALQGISATNKDSLVIYMSGGFNNGTFLDDVWSWRVNNPLEFWRKDYTPDELFTTAVSTSSTPTWRNNTPTIAYVTPDSNLTFLQRFWVPTKPDAKNGLRMEQRTYATSDKIAMLNSVGIFTIRDLANAGVYTILKLRGFDFPQVPLDARMTFTDICDYRALAIALVDKCTINLPSLYDGEKNQPSNVIPVFGGPPPANDSIAWHGRANYDFLLAGVDDPTVLTNAWDGCTYVPQIEGLFGPNVNGLGYVDQVTSIVNPNPTLENLFCRQSPGPRAYHSIVVYEERLYIMGGKQSEQFFYADTWYREPRLPKATISKFAKDHTPLPWFHFTSDAPGVFFEYRIWDPYNYKEIRPWTPVTYKTSVYWLDWREGGPGNGLYQLYVRAVDPAGNRDEKFVWGQNVYE